MRGIHVLTAAAMLAFALPAKAQTPEIGLFGALNSGLVTIKRIRTGWDNDQFAIETKETISNPAGCPSPDGYVAQAAQRGYKEHYALAISAMYSGRPVQVVVSDLDCAGGRPRIMGIHASS